MNHGMSVEIASRSVCDLFVSAKHYSRSPSIFWRGFALIEDCTVQGVCVFGQPSPALQQFAFRGRDFSFYELSRLVVQSKTKNAASFLVGNALRMLRPTPCAVVSFADSSMGHCGYVYQATNWFYTGATVSHDHLYLLDGKATHPMTLRDMGITDPMAWARANGIETIKPAPKHRYFYFCGNRRDKGHMLDCLAYPFFAYPKCPPSRYDDGDHLLVRSQPWLFEF